MGTKNNPGKFDCYANASSDEPMFILLARDALASELVDEWARRRWQQIARGEKPKTDLPMCKEAHDCAYEMRSWYTANVIAVKKAVRDRIDNGCAVAVRAVISDHYKVSDEAVANIVQAVLDARARVLGSSFL